MNILKIARDPEIALINVVERVVGLDMMDKTEPEQQKQVSDQVFDVIEGSTKEHLDKNTIRLVAMH